MNIFIDLICFYHVDIVSDTSTENAKQSYRRHAVADQKDIFILLFSFGYGLASHHAVVL